jgi:hypothetical protein
MATHMRIGATLALVLTCSLGFAGCAAEDAGPPGSDSGGATAASSHSDSGGAGAGLGGMVTGGTAGAGGMLTGGTAGIGTMSTGGTTGTGGTSAGDTAGTGGTAAGGTATPGGTATGGTAGTGGTATGGITITGGSSSGGATATGGDAGSGGTGAGDPDFAVFLLIGQSNMEGQAAPEAQDIQEDPRVRVLAYEDCDRLGRTYNQWYTAYPPLHGCRAGVGPGDYFAREMAAAFPNVTVGLIPCAISGVDIDFFRKGVVSARRNEFRIPPDDHRSGAYEWVIERARLAQQSGVIRGVLFHQGEADTGDPAWVGKVQEMVSDLRTDLGLEAAPFVAGELLHGGCCSSHNPLVNELPSQIPNAGVVSAAGLAGMDAAHFNLEGQRELGRRYAQKMQQLLTLP